MSDQVVYVWYDPKTNTPIYVGKGQHRRPFSHLNQSKKTRLSHTLRKRRDEGFEMKVKIIQAADADAATEMEICLIDLIGREDLAKGPLFNLTDGGEGTRGQKFSEARILALRSRVLSEETKAKISAAGKGRICSEETKAKISATKTGYKMTPEQCRKISAVQAGKKRGPLPAETREKISLAQKGRPLTTAHLNNVAAANRDPKNIAKKKSQKGRQPAAARRGCCIFCNKETTIAKLTQHHKECVK